MSAEGLNGRVIGAINNATRPSAPGVWPINSVFINIKNQEWPSYVITASGGNTQDISTPTGKYRVHTFSSPGTFTVSSIVGSNTVGRNIEYLVIGGGGGAGNTTYAPSYGTITDYGGGGGAGGYRVGTYTVTEGTFPVVVGAGGAVDANGSPSSLTLPSETITSAGGGRGGSANTARPGASGGSGGGGADPNGTGGSGNTPPTSPPQGFNGGGAVTNNAGGGGGAGSAGANTGAGGSGVTNNISNTEVVYARGGNAVAPTVTYVATPNLTIGSGGHTRGLAPSFPVANSAGKDGIVILRYSIVE